MIPKLGQLPLANIYEIDCDTTIENEKEFEGKLSHSYKIELLFTI